MGHCFSILGSGVGFLYVMQLAFDIKTVEREALVKTLRGVIAWMAPTMLEF